MQTIEEAAEALAAGRTSAVALVDEALGRIADRAVRGTFTAVHADAARAQARAIDALRQAGAPPSRYAGVPVTVKDLFDEAGRTTTAGSVVLRDAPPAAADAPAVARLRRAGFVVLGRTGMTEFAFSGLGVNPHHGTPPNPWTAKRAACRAAPPPARRSRRRRGWASAGWGPTPAAPAACRRRSAA